MVNEARRRIGQDSVCLLRVIQTDDDLLRRALFVEEGYRLRAGDAIHLAGALSMTAFTDSAQVIMTSGDVELLNASEGASIGALDPQAVDAVDRLRRVRSKYAAALTQPYADSNLCTTTS